MALTINTNVASLTAQRNLGKSQGALNKSMQRLSSGLRINSAKDDAAGLAISDRMTAQIRGLNQATRNANDAISMSQTAEGALQESTNILQRMRELAVQSSNDTNTSADRGSINSEVSQLLSELDRIASTTSFNGQVLLAGGFSGSGNGAVFQVGANASQTITVNIGAANQSALGLAGAATSTTVSVSGVALSGTTATSTSTSTVIGASGALNVNTFTAAQSAITTIDTAINTIDTIRGGLGAVQNRFESTISNLQNVSENLTAARSRILDADIAQETSQMTKMNILQQAGVSILSQANQAPQLALSLLG